jgi:hypothetical protein
LCELIAFGYIKNFARDGHGIEDFEILDEDIQLFFIFGYKE